MNTVFYSGDDEMCMVVLSVVGIEREDTPIVVRIRESEDGEGICVSDLEDPRPM